MEPILITLSITLPFIVLGAFLYLWWQRAPEPAREGLRRRMWVTLGVASIGTGLFISSTLFWSNLPHKRFLGEGITLMCLGIGFVLCRGRLGDLSMALTLCLCLAVQLFMFCVGEPLDLWFFALATLILGSSAFEALRQWRARRADHPPETHNKSRI